MEKRKLSFDEKMDLLVDKVLEMLADELEKAGEPATYRRFVTMTIPDWPHDDEGVVEVYTSDTWRVRAGVRRRGSDMFTFNFMESGSRDAVLRYLRAASTRKELKETVLRLARTVDDR